MKNGQLAVSKALGLLRIDRIITEHCIYCTILTGEMKGSVTVEYASTIQHITNTEALNVY